MEKQVVKLNRRVLRKTKDAEISQDIIVPDVKPDIAQIVSTNANAYIYKEELSVGKIRLDGNIDSYVIYLAENGETRSLALNMDFIESIDDEKIAENMRYKASVKLESIESKILNERKINVVAKISLYVEFYESSEVGILSAVEGDNLQKQEKSYKLKNLVGEGKAKATVKEDMGVQAGTVSEILKTEVNVKNIENKVSYNKVLSKGEANIKIVYQTEDMKVGTIQNTYPVMSFIDIENVQESHICETEFKIRNMLFKINSTESSKITVQVDFEVCTEVYSSKEITILQDVYSLDKEISFNRKEIEVSLDGEVKQEQTEVNEKVYVEGMKELIDVYAQINIVNKTASGSFVNYELEASLDIMYEGDTGGSVSIRRVALPFMMKVEEGEASFEIATQDFKQEGENVISNLQVVCTLKKDESEVISVLDNIEEKEPAEKSEYSMVVYFVKPNDTIWKIAKMFKVTMDSIIEANNLENPDKISVGERLYILK